MVPAAAFFGSVAPMISRLRAIAFSPSSTCAITGPGAHVAHQILVERALAMHLVEQLRLLLRQLQHAGGDDPQARALEAAIDLADQVAANAVGLDDG